MYSSSTRDTLPSGRSSAWNSSMPACLATASAAAFRSPVSIIVLALHSFFSEASAAGVPGFISSDITIYPAYFPSTAQCTTVPAESTAGTGIFSRSIRRWLPTRAVLPPTCARTP